MPKLEDVKKALEALDGGNDLYGVVISELDKLKSKVTEEKNRGITEVSKRNKEVESMKAYKKAMDALGFDPEESELDDFVSTVSDTMTQYNDIVKGKTKDGDLDITKFPQWKDLQKQLRTLSKNSEKLTADLEVERKEKETLRTKTRNNVIKTTLLKTLSDKVHGPDLLVNDLINNGRVSLAEDEKTVVFVEGEDQVDYDEGITKVLDERKDILKSNQSGGGGSGGSGGKGSSKDDKQKWVDEFNANR